MEINHEKEVALLTKRLQEETTKSIRYQALLDDTVQELEKYKSNNDSQHRETVEQEPKYHEVEGEK